MLDSFYGDFAVTFNIAVVGVVVYGGVRESAGFYHPDFIGYCS